MGTTFSRYRQSDRLEYLLPPNRSITKVNAIKLEQSSTRGTSFSCHKLDVNGPPAVDKVTCEILSRLPVKSLMRFKCVCKAWCILVEKDPYFIDLHSAHLKEHPNFFTVVKKPIARVERYGKKGTYTGLNRSVYLVTAEYLHKEKCEGIADIHGISKVKVPYNVHFFGPLNGLLGFYDYENYCGVRLVNVYTRQITPWIKSELDKKYEEQEDGFTSCELGYDPATKEHKVICLRRITSRRCLSFCEIFTVGGDEWRRIDDVPSNFVQSYAHSMYLNGSIYYSPLSFMKRGRCYNKIVVFEVGPEKFREITIPNFIIDHPREICITISEHVDLLEVDGQLALLYRINGSIVKLWLYDDVDDEHKRKNCWEEITIELPFVWDKRLILNFISVIGENQIILKSGCYDYDDPDEIKDLSYCIYNLTTKTFTKMGTRGIPYGSFFSTSMCDQTFKNSLWSVR